MDEIAGVGGFQNHTIILSMKSVNLEQQIDSR